MKKYFKDNELVSSLSHFVGFLLAISALVLLIVVAAKHGTAWHITSFSIFGASLILLYFASSVYHIIPKASRLKKIFQRIDLALIFVLIAGTYTPIALVLLRGAWGWSIFALVWALAGLGLALQIFNIKLRPWQKVFLYLLMGWMIVLAAPAFFNSIAPLVWFWLLIGGVFYTTGVIFYSLDKIFPLFRYFSLHDVFHIFVIAGSFSHFYLMYKYLVYIN